MGKVVRYSNTRIECYCQIEFETGDRVLISITAIPSPSVKVSRMVLRGLIPLQTIWEYNATMAGGYTAYMDKLTSMFSIRPEGPENPLDAIRDLLLDCTSVENARLALFAREASLSRHGESGAPGKSMTENDQLDGAVALLAKVKSYSPDDDGARIGLERAIESDRRRVRKDPTDVRAYRRLGLALSVIGDAGGCVAALQECLRLASDANTHTSLAIAYDRQGDVASAIEHYRRAAALDAENSDRHYNLGTVLGKCGALSESISELKEAIALDPENNDAYKNLSNSLWLDGQRTAAVRVLYERGVALGERDRLDESIQFLKAATEADPNCANAYYNLGGALARNGQHQDAIASFARVLALNPTDAEAEYKMALQLCAARELHQAKAALRRAMLHRPGYAEAKMALEHVNTLLTKVLALRGQHYSFAHVTLREFAFENTMALLGMMERGSAAQSVRKIWLSAGAALVAQGGVATDSAELSVEQTKCANLPCLLVRMPEPTETPECYFVTIVCGRDDERLGTKPQVFYFTLELGTTPQGTCSYVCEWFEDGSRQNHGLGPGVEAGAFLRTIEEIISVRFLRAQVMRAIESVQGSGNLAPSIAALQIGMACTREGRQREAILAFRRALELDPQLIQGHFGLAANLLSSEQFEEAIDAWRQVIALRPDLAEGHRNLGLALEHSGRREEAIEEYRQSVHLDPKSVEALCNLGSALCGAGMLHDGLSSFQKAIAIAPAWYWPHFGRGLALYRSGHLEGAEAAFKRALSLNSGDWLTLSYLALVLKQLGKGEESDRALREAERQCASG